ncbi:MAG: hypothetical protein ACI9CF_001381 [Candidatus Omnitrophota bacterium]|jgi:hypothetical protein
MKALIIKRRTVRLIWLAGLIAIAAYIQHGVLPPQYKSELQSQLKQETGYSIHFDQLHYIPFFGFHINNVHIEDAASKRRIRIKRIFVRLQHWSYLTKRLMNLSDIWLIQPRTTITLPNSNESQSTTLNDSENQDLTPYLALINPSMLRDDLNIGRINLIQGTLNVLGPERRPKLIEALQNVYIRLNYTNSKLLNWTAAFDLGAKSVHNSVQGRWTYASQHYEIDLVSNIAFMPLWALGLLNERDINVRMLNSKAKVHFSGNGLGIALVNAQLLNSIGDVNTAYGQINGRFEADLFGAYDPMSRAFAWDKGRFNLSKASLITKLETIGGLDEVNGRIDFDMNSIWTQNLKGYWKSTDFELEGKVQRDEAYQTEFILKQNMSSLMEFETFFPKYFKQKDILESFKGDFSIQTKAQGPINEIKSRIDDVELSIQNARIELPQPIGILEAVQGRVKASLRNVRVEDLSFVRKGDAYTLSGDGQLEGEKQFNFELKHPRLTMVTQFNWQPELEYETQINKLHIKTRDSDFDIRGQVSWDSKLFKLGSKGSIDLEELTHEWLAQGHILNHLKPIGQLSFLASTDGDLGKPESIRFNIESESKSLRLFDRVSFDQSEVDIEYIKGQAKLNYARFGFYGGETRARGVLNMATSPQNYFDMNIFCHDVNIQALANEAVSDPSQMQGIMNADLSLTGYGNDLSTLRGGGNFQVTGKDLWVTSKYRGLAKVPFIRIEGIDPISFNRINGAFLIGDNRVQLEDTLLSSPQIDLHINGDIGFDRHLDLELISRFSEGLIQETNAMGGFAPAIMEMAETKITQYHLGGTLFKPIKTTVE